jgi:hypothetical protein
MLQREDPLKLKLKLKFDSKLNFVFRLLLQLFADTTLNR